MLSVGEVDLELDDDLGEEQHSYAWQDQGVLKQIQAESSGTETSQEQPSIIQEYVLLLCRFEAVTMLDYETLRFCLPKFDFLAEDCGHVKALLVLLKGAFDIRPDEVVYSYTEDHNYSIKSFQAGLHMYHHQSPSRERDVCDHLKYLHYLKESAHEAPDDVLDLVLTATAVTSQCSAASPANKSVISPVSQLAIPLNLMGSLQYVCMYAPENVLPACPNTGALLLVPTLPPTGSLLEKCLNCHSPWDSEDPVVHCWTQNSIRLYTRKHLY
ncbi:hypothetical protein AWC38_SpisGene18285 [Stylophora pistillata]|uniref:Uncharacterized protein n=1 Tax=Stylophora pistillata TaxID=50429 RepID=A0A2B4RLM3_STYPI|nr:hypothetical protein AWC38_SpisGene18285 [Stylophora pistillata]